MTTDDLIRRLAHDLRPVDRLRGPWVRTGAWLVAAAINFLVLVLVLARMQEPNVAMAETRFLVEQAAAVALAVTAAVAALASTVPGTSRRILWLPAVSLAVWVAAVAAGIAGDAAAGIGLSGQPHWTCSAAILLGTLGPAAVLIAMLRRGVLLTPRLTASLGIVAAAGLANVTACLFDPVQGSAGVLVWHGATILALVAAAAVAGRHLRSWHAVGAWPPA